MATDAQMKAKKKYEKNNIKQVLLKFHLTHDKEILDMILSKENKQGYIKGLIEEDMKNNK